MKYFIELSYRSSEEVSEDYYLWLHKTFIVERRTNKRDSTTRETRTKNERKLTFKKEQVKDNEP
jgi:hypothetical protein